jgi:hypothetical protein
VYLYLCNIPQTQNFIAKLQVEGQCITEHDESAAILDIYSNLIGTDRDRSRTVNLDGIDLPSYDFAALYYPITEDEVWSPIKQLPSREVLQFSVGTLSRKTSWLQFRVFGEKISETCRC